MFKHLFGFICAACLTLPSIAGVITVVVDGTTYTSTGGPVVFGGGTTPDITLNLGHSTGTRTVRIYDAATIGTTGTPAAGIGKLTINGSATRAARLNLLIADGDQGFPANIVVAASLDPGLATLGGTSAGIAIDPNVDYAGVSHDYDESPNATIDSVPSTSQFPGWSDTSLRGIIIPNPSLRRQTMLAAVVSGDICPGYEVIEGNGIVGRIEVGQVVRLQARRNDDGTGGNLNAHVIAVSMDRFLSYELCGSIGNGLLFTDFRAVESVSAGNALRGKVIAQGRARDDVAWQAGQTRGRLFEREQPFEDPPGSGTLVFASGEPVHACGGVPVAWINYPQWITRGSIFNVRVGPFQQAEGISGDIVSEKGRIFSVRSTGPVKLPGENPTNPLKIRAADGVLEVRTASENSGSTVSAALDKRVIADVVAYNADQLQLRTPPDFRDEGVVHLVETKGKFTGEVRCFNMAHNPAFTDPLGRSGVIVAHPLPPTLDQTQSTVYLDWPRLYVEHLAHNVCLLSPHFNAVTIGWQFKGTLVAFGTAAGNNGPAGTIGGLNIGNAGFEDSAENALYPGYVRGFVGGFAPPMNMRPGPYASPAELIDDPTPPALWGLPHVEAPLGLIPMPYDADRWLYARPKNPAADEDGGAIDSVIRAELFIDGKPHIYQMTRNVVLPDEDRKAVVADYKPRVECPGIADGLAVQSRGARFGYLEPIYGGLHSGCIWSGRLQYVETSPGQWAIDTSHAAAQDDFAQSPEFNIGRIGPNGDLYALGDRVGFVSCKVQVGEDVCGEVHTNGWSPTFVVVIDGKLATLSEWTGFDADVPDFTERTPRGLPPVEPGPPPVYQPALQPYGVARTWRWSDGTSPLFTRFEGPLVMNGGSNGLLLPPLSSAAPDDANWSGALKIGDPWTEPQADLRTLGPIGLPGVTTLDQRSEYDRLSRDFSGMRTGGTTLPELLLDQVLGGGVGVVPYGLHDLDCWPPNVSNPLLANDIAYWNWMAHPYNPGAQVLGDINARAWLRFYGSLYVRTESQPMVVDRLNQQTQQWVSAGNAFKFEVLALNNSWRPILAIYPTCYGSEDDPDDYRIQGGLYRIRNWAVTSEDPLVISRAGIACEYAKELPYVADFTYYFRLTGASADVGQQGGVEGPDGLLDNNDFIVFINWFFAHDLRADIGTTGGVPGSDGLWDNNDFVVFIDFFFREQNGETLAFSIPCPPGQGNRPAPGGQSAAPSPGGQSRFAAPGSQPAPSHEMAAQIRAALEQMIAAEPPGPRRDQLIQMLNSMPPSPTTPSDR